MISEDGQPPHAASSEARNVRDIDDSFHETCARLEIAPENLEGDRALLMAVDDDTAVLSLSTQMLAHAGFKVLPFEKPSKALHAFRLLKDYIHLVLLDFSMPEMDGEQLFDELRDECRDIKTLLISGYADHDSIRSMMRKRLDGYLAKPYTPTMLIEKVEATLAG